MTSIPDRRYNFDIAIALVFKYYGNNPMNHFFLAEALMGFGHPDHLNVDMVRVPVEGYMRLVEDDPERRFWTAIYTCYCLTRKKYNEVCLYIWKYIDMLAAPRLLNGHAQAMYDALMSDVVYFEKDRQGVINGEIDKAIGGRQNLTAKVWPMMRKFLEGGFGDSEYNQNQIQQSALINQQLHSDNRCILKALRAMMQEIEITERTQSVLPLPLKLMQADHFNGHMRQIEGEHQYQPLTNRYFEGPVAQCLVFQSQYMGVNSSSDTAVNSLKFLLFYINLGGRFEEYLKGYFKSTHVIEEPSKKYDIPTNTQQFQYTMSAEDRGQLGLLEQEVRNFPNFERLMRSQQMLPPKATKKGGGYGS